MKITLRKFNIVKEADSEDIAKALEKKGFIRDVAQKGGKGGGDKGKTKPPKPQPSIKNDKEEL